MATNSAQIAKSGKFGDLRSRLVFLLLALVVYRVGAHIPVPGIDPGQLKELFKGQQGGILNLFNMFSGGALSRFTVFALGIMPYISASIIMQLLTYVVPTFEQLKKEGEVGPPQDHAVHALRHAWAWHIFQSHGHCARPGKLARPGAGRPAFGFRMTAAVSLTAGTIFLMWLGEQITERGLGNGISIIIFAGIAAGLPNAVGGLLELVRTGAMSILVAVVHRGRDHAGHLLRGLRRARPAERYSSITRSRQVGNKVYGGQSSHLPLKLNMAGVIPPIFASSIILLPATVVSWFSSGRKHALAKRHRRHA